MGKKQHTKRQQQQKQPGSPKRRGTYGAYSKNHPRSVQWMVDYDYLNKLSDEEKEWLAQFTDEWVGGDLSSEAPLHATPEQRKAAYRKNNSQKRDWYSKMDAQGRLSRRGVGMPKVSEDEDDSPTPEYLNYPGYKRAVSEFRALMPEDLRRRTPDSEEVRRALGKIQRIVRTHQPELPEDDHEDND